MKREKNEPTNAGNSFYWLPDVILELVTPLPYPLINLILSLS
jgi:hypothetical protein